MHRISARLGWGLVVTLLALMLPATAAAAYPYTYKVEADTCTHVGGAHGFGYVYFRVFQKEWGRSGTNYLKVRFRLKSLPVNVGTWTTVWKRDYVGDTFPNDSGNWWWRAETRDDFTQPFTGYHRLIVRLQWWDKRPGPDRLLWQKKLKGKICQIV